MKTYAIDFETYYDNDLSVTIQGTVNYARQAHIYMVSIYGPGVEYVGPVEDAPWWGIDGAHWVSHNASFDEAVYRAACIKQQVPGRHVDAPLHIFPHPVTWDCTADMCAYLGFPRSLAGAVKEAYSVELDKAMRGSAKGKHWPDDFKEDDQKRMLEYALRDAQYCWQLWKDFSDKWPSHERQLSRITRKRCHQGVTVSKEALFFDLGKLYRVMELSRFKIPWSDTGVILSHNKVEEYCLANNLPVPDSLAKDSESANKWEEKYGHEHPIIGAIRDYRKANRMYKLVEGMANRIMPDGRMNFGLKYFGAHTGRWSGSDGMNMQNPNKDAVFGVDIRGHLKAGPGKKFVIADYAQIEPRCAAWLVGDNSLLDKIRDGYGIYEAFALSTGMWEGEKGTLKKTNKSLYDLAKAQVLALGYGCGPKKFIMMAKMYADLDISLEESRRIVGEYRERNQKIVRSWYKLEGDMFRSYQRKDTQHTILLPSGRELLYTDFKPVAKPGTGQTSLRARQGRGKDYVFIWGGLLFENAVQATARDVLAHAILELESRGVPVLWSAHDEVICEIAEDHGALFIKQIMETAPPWLPGIPLEVELVDKDPVTKEPLKHYLK